MAPLPTGTVTFLFTDIEGSTKLARNFPEIWPRAQARQLDLLDKAVKAHRGNVFRTIGDEVNAAFETAGDALAAAMDAQHALLAEDWGEIGSIHVRMGIHTGPATPQVNEYSGYLTLSHTKRLVSIASGGQILVSEAAEALLQDSLPGDTTLLNLGKQRLKDFERDEQVFQVVAPGLPADFPPVRTLQRSPNHLPVQLTSFIGRSKEIGDLEQLLSQERLITLTGPGGSGKTRLALQVAGEMSEQFEDGVFFIGLAPINDLSLVPSTIAAVLGVPETPGRSMMDRLKEDLIGKTLLLLLDNFEQVIPAAPLVAELLVMCPRIKILVTSREGLRISGEHEYPVPPLALPDFTQLPPLETLSQFPAVELFIQRALAVKPDFQLTQETAPAIAEICYRLDGLPLAIELAAARIKMFPPRVMLTRLEHRLDFLTGGARDQPARQQTLRNAIRWSYDLLDEDERKLFQQMSVFVGGFTLDAAEAVAEAVAGEESAGGSALDLVGSLVDKSLLKEVGGLDGEPRLWMLETLREFALEQLEASGEQDRIRRRHALYFLALAEQGGAKLEGAGQVEWIRRMELENDNLRAALKWSRAVPDSADICLRLARKLGYFWETRGYYSEGREQLAAILEAGFARERTAARADLLARAAELAYRQSDYPATAALARESLQIYRAVGDSQGTASALVKLGNAAAETGDFAAAAGFLEEALSIWREQGDRPGTARALISLGWAALRSGDLSLAEARLVEALSLSRQLGDTRRTGFELAGLGEIAMRQGDTGRAARLVEESLDLRRQLGNQWGIGVCLGILGAIAMREKDWDRAVDRLSESLEVRKEIGDQSGCAWCLERFGEVFLARGQIEKAARLFGAGAALRAPIHSVVDPIDRSEYQDTIQSLREKLGVEHYRAAWDEGSAMSLDQAAAYALTSGDG